MSDKSEYMEFLESCRPVRLGMVKFHGQKNETAEEHLNEADATPNTDPEANSKEYKQKGSNEFKTKLTAPGGDATVNPDDEADVLKKAPTASTPQNDVVKWDGTGKMPTTLSDPLLSTLINKFTSQTPEKEGTKDVFNEKEDKSEEEKSVLELLENKEKKEIESSELTEDVAEELQSTLLNRLIVEMNQIDEEGIDEVESEEDGDISNDVEDELWTYDEDSSDDEEEDEEIGRAHV